jgi:hypothetical protein
LRADSAASPMSSSFDILANSLSPSDGVTVEMGEVSVTGTSENGRGASRATTRTFCNQRLAVPKTSRSSIGTGESSWP